MSVEFFTCEMTTEGFDQDVRWQPFVDHSLGTVGFKGTRLADGAERYIYLNPSSGGDEGQADVFVYEGPTTNPAEGTPYHFYEPFTEVAS